MTQPTYLVAVSNGSIYIGYSPDQLTRATNGASALADTPDMGMQSVPGSPSDASPQSFHRHMLFCDGTNYKRLDAHTGAVETWTADAGTLPVDGSGNKATMIALYRNRVVMSGLPEDPANWFMSAVGDHLDWDYSPATTTATQAVAGNLTDAGEVAEGIRALIPFSDDLMVFGCTSSMWRLTGDPADGGYIDNLSYGVGITGPDAWAFDAHNTMYFMGTDGLYRVPRDGSALENLSRGTLDTTFSSIDLTADRVILAWDYHSHGLHIFITRDDGTSPRSWFWDSRTESFWPVSLPDDNGPVSVVEFEADAEDDRSVLLGGKDGYIRRFRDLRPNDNNGVSSGSSVEVAIDSYVDIGPIVTTPLSHRQYMTEMQHILGENSHDVSLSVYRDASPEAVMRSTSPVFKRTLTTGRTSASRQRISGAALRFRLQNDTIDETWAYEQGLAFIRPGGKFKGSER